MEIAIVLAIVAVTGAVGIWIGMLVARRVDRRLTGGDEEEPRDGPETGG